MRKLYLLFTILLLNCTHGICTGDSLHYLTPKDTVFLQVDHFGNKVFIHTMEEGQSLFSLAQFYGIKIYHLVAFNSHIEPEAGFVPGTQVYIPIPDSAIVKCYEKGFQKAGYVPVQYIVRHGDTFYRIAKHFFNIPLDTLQAWNGLENTMMFSGMKLHIGYLSIDGIPESLRREDPINSKMQLLVQQFQFRESFEEPTFQNGAAYWQREKEGRNDYYCLHRKAPVGSVVRIKNPMRNRMIFAKVIAPIPDRVYGDDIIIVLSPTVAKMLAAKDPKFYVEIEYFEEMK